MADRQPISLKWVKKAMWVLYVLCLLEGTTRVYWANEDLAWTATVDDIYRSYFPRLKNIQPAKPGEKRVLLLGGSVLLQARGEIQRALNRTGEKFVVYKSAKHAQSSRDSLLKYRLLESEAFDLVIYYHAINEIRANNIRSESFRSDYSHYRLYAQVDALERYEAFPYVLLPASIHLAFIALEQFAFEEDYVPKGPLKRKGLEFGSDIKTAGPVRSNIERTIALALERDQPFVLMSFASYQPEDYSKSRFQDGTLGYGVGLKGVATELWGHPDNVVLGLEAHNKVIRRVGESFDGQILFVDQEALIPKQGDHFVDICHLSEVGYERFASNLVTALQSAGLVPRTDPSRGPRDAERAI